MTRHNKDGKTPLDSQNWLDIGCEDWRGAAENRERIASNHCGDYWFWLEAALAWIPEGKALPFYIPTGNLPQIHGRSFSPPDEVQGELER